MKENCRAYLEHTAIKVKDLDKSIAFFNEVFGMTVREWSKPGAALRQVWLFGGVQLCEDANFDDNSSRFMHLGIMVEDLEDTLEKAYARGVTAMEQGRNWIRLPDGLSIEVMQARPGAVKDALSVEPR